MVAIKKSVRQHSSSIPNNRLGDLINFTVRAGFKSAVSRLPAVVLKVHYDQCSVDCRITIRNDYGTNNKNKYADVYQVPLHMESGNSNKARLSMPIKAGDVIEVGFADKDSTNWLLSDGTVVTEQESFEAFGMNTYFFPLVAYTCPQLAATARPFDPEKIVLENEKAVYTLAPDGTHHLVDGQGSDVKLSGGKLVATVPNGAIINGCQITPDGNVITADGVDLNAFYAEYKAHVHGGVTVGGAKTSAPS